MNTRGEFEGIITRYFIFYNNNQKINISEYNSLELIEYNGSKINLNDLTIKLGEVPFNLADKITEFMKNEGEASEIVFDNGAGHVLYVTNMSFYYNDAENSLESFHITGYILSR